MKSILLLFSLVFLALPLHAAPMLVVEASLTEKHADNSTDKWKAKPITVADGTPAIFHRGGLILKVTPASMEKGIVAVPMLITRGTGQNARLLGRPTVTTRPGQVVGVGIDNLQFTVVVTVAK
ncbi:MAG TPA: hypothetical protein VGO11_04315 [Chthoniobacteraceae bacterium]|jgi:hypothetical protein|nr:hypothetical protein [Chthoniobacteraceae bacterium]